MTWLTTLGLTGVLIEDLRLEDRSVHVVVQPDLEEVGRRAKLGAVVPVTDRDLLEAMAELPHRIPISWSALDPVVAAVLDTAPDATLHRTASHVERLYAPPLELVAVLADDSDWRRGIRRVGLFAPDALRVVRLTRPVARLQRAQRETERLGIGLVTEGFELVVSPSRRYLRPGPHRWRLIEAIYGLLDPDQLFAKAPR